MSLPNGSQASSRSRPNSAQNSEESRVSSHPLTPPDSPPSYSDSYYAEQQPGLHQASNASGRSARKGVQRSSDGTASGHSSHSSKDGTGPEEEGGWHMRQGFEYSAEQLQQLTTAFYMYYNEKRHETAGNLTEDPKLFITQDWRMKDRLKTVSALLALCLNIGVDPPDVMKPNPCAKLECWIDPTAIPGTPGNGPMDKIGQRLQNQYEKLSSRPRYKFMLDPHQEDAKKYATTMRKSAKDERILFHYNGHGVPKPTISGEIWVFNKNYTQYIPVSLDDLLSWIGAPTIFVFDCADAGLLIKNFEKHLGKTERESSEYKRQGADGESPIPNDCINLVACREGEVLPTNPSLPADLFTCCLTTPIEMALRFFILQNPLTTRMEVHEASRVPGNPSERRTPIGELNWIFTAITDTIAWTSLPRALFKKLFRQDLMVAALFRNFLLAQRIMRRYHCHPQCLPLIPSTHDHPLWKSWDLAVEMVLSQMPRLEQNPSEYQHSDFFSEQLAAFEVYLAQGAVERKEPEQLPVVLQVLLSQVHRLRALILLSKFLDFGPWAVNLALAIGIFPYVSKLLQSQATDLKAVMVFIWARIIAVDLETRAELLKDNGYQYFISMLNPITGESVPPWILASPYLYVQGFPIKDVMEHRAMAAFIIAMFCKGSSQSRIVSLSAGLMENCLNYVAYQDTENPLLRQWACLCLSMLWKDYADAKWSGIRSLAPQKLCDNAWDPVPEVRTATLHALTTFLGISDLTEQVAKIEETIASSVLLMSNDGSVIVRKELVIFFSTFVIRYQRRFIVTAYEQLLKEGDVCAKKLCEKSSASNFSSDSLDEDTEAFVEETVYSSVWKQVLIMSVDPDIEIARDSALIVDYIHQALIYSPLGVYAQPVMDSLLRFTLHPGFIQADTMEHGTTTKQGAQSPRPQSIKQDGYFSSGLKRTASVAASLRNLALKGVPESSLSASAGDSNLTITNLGERPTGSTNAGIEWTNYPDEERSLPHAAYHKAKYPQPKFQLHRKHDQKQPLPFESQFFDWAVEYFREPQMKQHEADEPGSTDYNGRLWRRNRNEKILEATQKLKEQAGSSAWSAQSGYFDNGSQPSKMCFHQYDNHLVVTDERDTVRVWEWEAQKLLNCFSNGNPDKSRITGLRFINEDDQTLLMTGSSDGVIKVFRQYDSAANHVVSAFRALTDLVPSTYNAGLVFEWLQGRGCILVAGDAKAIRVWNASTEMCANDIPARSGSCVTSLTSDQVEGNIFVAGFGDGAVRVYDQREQPMKSRVQQWKEHQQWVTNVHLQRGGQRELVSGSRNGEVKLWDIRMGRSLKTIQATKDSLRSLSVHEHAPVFATGSERHNVRVYNMNGSFLSASEPYSNFLAQNRSAPICSTSFHPHRMMLACAALNDNHVNLFSCAGKKRNLGKDA